MPGSQETLSRLLLTTEDVTEREEARRAEVEHRNNAEGIFEHSPASLWIEDFSQIRVLLKYPGSRDNGFPDVPGRASRVCSPVHARNPRARR
jgi:hypothetical protein